MFGFGFWEVVLIAVIALLVLGPRRLPEVARQLGRMMRELRRATTELKQGIDRETRETLSGIEELRPKGGDFEQGARPGGAPGGAPGGGTGAGAAEDAGPHAGAGAGAAGDAGPHAGKDVTGEPPRPSPGKAEPPSHD